MDKKGEESIITSKNKWRKINVLGGIKGKLSGEKFISMKQIETEIIKIWEYIPKIQIYKTCKSIYDRIGDCIEMKGGFTNY